MKLPVNERCELLIREALCITDVIASLRAKLHLIENELDRYFPRQEPEEHVDTEFGLAHRQQFEEVRLDPLFVEAAKRAFGPEFTRYFSEEPSCAATAECRALLSDSNSLLGKELRGMIHIKRRRMFSFSPRRMVRSEVRP